MDAFKTLDSGARRSVDTGSVRDSREGKGRYDLLPGEVLNFLLECDDGADWESDQDYCLESYFRFLMELTPEYAYYVAVNAVCSEKKCNSNQEALLFIMPRLARLYERGASKYDDNNWKKGQPLSWYVDSMGRHLNKALLGQKDEDHTAAVVWNVCGFIWTKWAIERGELPESLNT